MKRERRQNQIDEMLFGPDGKGCIIWRQPGTIWPEDTVTDDCEEEIDASGPLIMTVDELDRKSK